ncbi:MAG: Penicillin-binding protein 2D [Syntrophorhabdus sp. PtaU1.Bin050]|nr:MAG: Penicillin-binding protein 2D [Syntrophorhabdus sp. PtaU1.Bin050]
MSPFNSRLKKVGLTAGVMALVSVCLVLWAFIDLHRGSDRKKLPSFYEVKEGYQESDAVLLDRHGEVIHALRIDAEGRRLGWVALKDISPAMVRAVLQVEDKRFHRHQGIDWYAVGAAMLSNLKLHRLRGASTITMQVVSILDKDLKPHRRGRRVLVQKWEQAKAAVSLERGWTKDQILEAYLNLISFRGELEGIGTASRGLFDKEPSGLNEPEAYLLASLITSPNTSSAVAVQRACYLSKNAGASCSCGDIRTAGETAFSRPYRIRPAAALAPHVARMLLKDGKGKVVSTLDGRLQRFVREVLVQTVGVLKGKNVYDGAAMVVENKTGEILAYVGNTGTSPTTVFVDGIKSLRQAGSTLKPFLYEFAIEKKFLTAASVLEDSPLHVTTANGLYVPHNYDNIFRGPVSVRKALSSSINIPAVRTLLLVGVAPFVEGLRELGFASLTEEPEFYGYSIALGSADITLYELVNAYRVLANGGVQSEMRFTFEGKKSRTRAVLDERAVFLTSHILSDRQARSATFGLENPLSTRFWTAAKTGTSKDMRDNWCIGFSDTYTVGVWVGNFSGEPMRDVTGITGAAPVWLEIMNYLHREKTSKAPKPPRGIVSAHVRFQENIEPPREEWFIEDTEPVSVVKLDKVHAKPCIIYPVNESVISIDPEIPEDAQRVPFRFEPAIQHFEWTLNDQKIGADGPRHLWKPERGTYVLGIVNKEGTVLDSVTFTVR